MSLDISKITPSPQSLVVESSPKNTSVLLRHKAMLNDPNLWHKFVVNDGQKYDRNEVLKVLLEQVYPLDLIPVCYTKTSTSSMFLARNCGEAIQKFAEGNLIVKNPLDPSTPFKLTIVLHFSSTRLIKVDAQKSIMETLSARFDSFTKTLNLDRFELDPNLIEFTPLYQPKIMYFVLHLAKILNPKRIRLKNNRIRTFFPLEALGALKLEEVDLRDNLLDSFSNPESTKDLSIEELWLDGNPLCNNFDEVTYINAVKENFPNVTKLDGILLLQNKAPPFRRHFLCENAALDMVNLFMEHYFSLYDSNRTLLEGLYHKNALFSLTSEFKSGQSTSSNAELRHYQILGRNLKRLADFSKSDKALSIGNQKIIKTLNQLPPTTHDPCNFTIDLLNLTDCGATLVINGVYKEPPDNIFAPERIFAFCRTFVLERKNDEFCIVNELLHVYNALTCQANRAFIAHKPILYQDLPAPKTVADHEKVTEALRMITGLNKEWSEKCLEDSNYDLHKTLTIFVDLYKLDRIPQEAFMSDVSKLFSVKKNTSVIQSENVPVKSQGSSVINEPILIEEDTRSSRESVPMEIDEDELEKPSEVIAEKRIRFRVNMPDGTRKWQTIMKGQVIPFPLLYQLSNKETV